MTKTIKQDQGVAGLTILLSLVVMLFIIGLIVMIFAIMGDQMRTASYTTTTATATNESVTTPIVSTALAQATKRSVSCGAITRIYNGTSQTQIGLTNFTQTNCNVINATATTNWATTIRVTYSYTYEADNTATDVMNDTVGGISGVTDWFDIFIVIGAMVVLILLTVIIITSIRGSGMISDGGSSGARTVGTA